MNKEANTQSPACRLGKVGGEAVIEGVMMRAGSECCTAVRLEDKSIHVYKTEHVPLRRKHKICNVPMLRGVINFVESMLLSYKILGISAQAFGGEIEEETKFEKWLSKKFGKNIMDVAMVIGLVLGFALAFLLFFYLPVWIGGAVAGTERGILKSLVESVIKIGIFIGYILLVSLMPDIRRTFQYHGSEHKSIFCYESGAPLTVENVKKQSRFHPRCGTSFIFVMLLISFFVALLIPAGLPTVWRVVVKLLVLPVIIGLGFEFIMYAGKHENIFTKILSAPGLWMQRITTKEPDDSMIEIAITALKAALHEEFPEQVLTLIDAEKQEYLLGVPEADGEAEATGAQAAEASDEPKPEADEPSEPTENIENTENHDAPTAEN